MIKENKIVAKQAEPNPPRVHSPERVLDQLVRGMLVAQGFRLDP